MIDTYSDSINYGDGRFLKVFRVDIGIYIFLSLALDQSGEVSAGLYIYIHTYIHILIYLFIYLIVYFVSINVHTYRVAYGLG